MSAAEWTYQLLLRAYPPDFRATYSREMTLVFRDLHREMRGGVRFWAEIIGDVARSAPPRQMELARRRWTNDIQLKEGVMMTMAILAILIGAVETVNGLQEGWFGGMVNGDGRSLTAGTLVAVAGMLLLTSGIALLRRTPRAMTLARAAVITLLAVVVFASGVTPRMSILTTILGVGFPIAYLLYERLTRGRGELRPTAV